MAAGARRPLPASLLLLALLGLLLGVLGCRRLALSVLLILLALLLLLLATATAMRAWCLRHASGARHAQRQRAAAAAQDMQGAHLLVLLVVLVALLVLVILVLVVLVTLQPARAGTAQACRQAGAHRPGPQAGPSPPHAIGLHPPPRGVNPPKPPSRTSYSSSASPVNQEVASGMTFSLRAGGGEQGRAPTVSGTALQPPKPSQHLDITRHARCLLPTTAAPSPPPRHGAPPKDRALDHLRDLKVALHPLLQRLHLLGAQLLLLVLLVGDLPRGAAAEVAGLVGYSTAGAARQWL